MNKKLGAAVCVLSLLGTQATWADSISGELHLIHGKVLVSKGKGYVLSGVARSGDRILVGSNGSAILSFPGGCDVQLNPGQIYTVPAVSPCAVAYSAPQQIAPPPPPAPLPVTAPLIDSTTAIIGGGLLGAAALGAGAYLLFVSKN